MIIKKFVKSCRYDPRLLIISIIFLGEIIAIGIGISVYKLQSKHIAQLKVQINKIQSEIKIKKSVQPVKTASIALKLDGIFQDKDGLYAVFNGHLYKEGDRVADKFEIVELSAYKVSVKSSISGETTFFTLVNPATIQKK